MHKTHIAKQQKGIFECESEDSTKATLLTSHRYQSIDIFPQKWETLLK